MLEKSAYVSAVPEVKERRGTRREGSPFIRHIAKAIEREGAIDRLCFAIAVKPRIKSWRVHLFEFRT